VTPTVVGSAGAATGAVVDAPAPACPSGSAVAKSPSLNLVVPPPERCTTTLKGVVPLSVMS